MLRKFKSNTKQHDLYKKMYKNQTYDFVLSKIEEYSKLDKCQMSMKEALDMMDNFIDPSDPDIDLPNSIHSYQTAERIRKKYPENYEFQICGLIHDLGKILFMFNEPNWAVVGDTFVLGCKFPESIVYYDTLQKENQDCNKSYNTTLGVYKKHCGIRNLKFSFGHDEYLYIVLKNNKNHSLSEKYLDMIRFHSCYPWHTKNEYSHFMKEEDKILLKNVLELNQFDLYSKEDNPIIKEDTKKYYSELLEKYFPEKLNW